MKAYIGVTDTRWAQFLAARPHLTEANFWRPSGRGFSALNVGEPFAFKTHYPENRIVGLGIFSGFMTMLVSEAWDLFGEGNGVPSLTEMRTRIRSYRRGQSDASDPVIGCIMLRDVSFLPASAHLPAPENWAPNIVSGKGYEAMGSPVEELMAELLKTTAQAYGSLTVPGSVFGDPRLTPLRLGQRSFKAMVLNSYNRRCAFTGDKIVPVLQAAHIQPVSEGGENRLDNGLLLRSDVHTLFDSGYLGLDDKYRLRVSPGLRREFGNGEEFYARAGRVVDVPGRRVDRPAKEFLQWHADTRFRAA